jgi:nitrogen fixation protein FixH|tara:strand:- start:4786 stop:5235 length:450 start_codon:yes stop_codon:yes gene_type:complete
MTRKFTGRHMAVILILFFGTIIAVNFTMARFALSTFGGTVVDNSYVASQNYNKWLDEGRAAQELGWTLKSARAHPDGIVVTLMDADGPLRHAGLAGTAEHPLGQREDLNLEFTEKRPGVFVAPLAEGRWKLRLRATRSGEDYRAIRTVE